MKVTGNVRVTVLPLSVARAVTSIVHTVLSATRSTFDDRSHAMLQPVEPAFAAINTVADARSLAPAASVNTALNVADVPVPALGVIDVLVIDGAGTVHDPIAWTALELAVDPVALR